MDNQRLADFQIGLLNWAEENCRDLPWRGVDVNAFEVLIAEIFLKQTRVQTVKEIFPEFIEKYQTPEDLSNSSRTEIIDIIRPLGLYNNRADALIEISEALSGTGVPNSQDKLMELPEVGPYVANATLCFGFGEPRPIVDSNVIRVYSRLAGKSMDDWDRDSLWQFAEKALPKDRVMLYNQALLDFGSLVCSHHNPNCQECFARSYCEYYQTKVDN